MMRSVGGDIDGGANYEATHDDGRDSNDLPAGLKLRGGRDGVEVVEEPSSLLFPSLLAFTVVAVATTGLVVANVRSELAAGYLAVGIVAAVVVGGLLLGVLAQTRWMELDRGSRIGRIRSQRLLQRLPCLRPSTVCEYRLDQLGT